jgi:hypothetical protein
MEIQSGILHVLAFCMFWNVSVLARQSNPGTHRMNTLSVSVVVLVVLKVFLQRKPYEVRVNPYMKVVLPAWKANHDLQFVLDPYACAM